LLARRYFVFVDVVCECCHDETPELPSSEIAGGHIKLADPVLIVNSFLVRD
jgi:hypothetical protein|tara:strand:+ start:2810 stop:2962 length:153 start_codon:yes stop_codon:yes gene_type:complete